MTKTNTINELINLANRYDRFTCYIENYKQQKQAEERNERIMKNFIETAATIGVDVTERDFSYIVTNTGSTYSKITVEEAVNNLLKEKEEISMKPENTPTINLNATTNTTSKKEETTMMNNLATRTLDMNKTERLMYVHDCLGHVTKTSDELYIKKDELAQFLFDNDIISRMPGKNELKKTKRQELVDILNVAVQNLVNNKVITPVNNKPATHQVICIDHAYYNEKYVEFEGTLEQCQDYAEANRDVAEGGDANLFTYRVEPKPASSSDDAKAKTDKLFALIKACAADNEKKGFGYTISSFMLQACILNAGAGVSKLKGHTVTADENKMTQDIYAWLKKKGFIKPLVYSVKEDEKVRVYMPEYKGKTQNTTVKMIPWSQSNGYTAKKITSFLVTVK